MLNTLERDVVPDSTPEVGATETRLPDAPLTAPSADEAKGRGWWRSTPALFGVFVVAWMIAATLAGMNAPSPVTAGFGLLGMALFALTVMAALYRALRGVVDLVYLAPGRLSVRNVEGIAAILGNSMVVGFGMLVAYLSTVGFSRGRQLRRFGRVLLPGLRSNPEWTTSAMALEAQGEVPADLADQWRENGKTEHASVAAFARLTLDLMALGAPPTLIAAANRDALDEIRHAEICFSMARTLDGKAVSPAPFPQAQSVATLPGSRTLALAKLAVDSLVDGALHEGVSARIIAKLAQRCEVPGIRAGLKEIAADEGRHAAHGWAVVLWCLDQGGAPVGAALLGAIRALPKAMRSALPAAASDGGWERWGIHGHALEASEYAAGLAHVTERVRTAVVRRAHVAA